ncbi:MAG: hypothetical protein QXW52_07070 [Candidatus Caldarchaeum sp.]
MSIVGVVANRLAIENFGPVFATVGTVTVNSKIFPAVSRAAVIDFAGTLNGQLGTVGGNLNVSAVGAVAFTGASPNTIVIRARTNAGDYTGTIESITLLVIS